MEIKHISHLHHFAFWLYVFKKKNYFTASFWLIAATFVATDSTAAAVVNISIPHNLPGTSVFFYSFL